MSTGFDLGGALIGAKNAIGNGINNAEKSVGGFLSNTYNDFVGTPGSNAYNSAVKSGIPYAGDQSAGSKAYMKSQGSTNGLLPTKSTAQLHQDNIAANQGVAKATAAAVKDSQPKIDDSTTQIPPAAPITPPTNLPINGSDNGSTVDANGNIIPGTQTPPPTQNQQAVSGLLTQANQSPAYTDAIAAENAAQQKITDLRNQEGTALSQIGGAGSPQTSGSAAGSAMTTQSEFQNEIANAQSTLTQAQQQAQQAISEQGAQTTAGNEAASQTSPVGQFGLLTNPQTGQPLNPTIANNAIQTAVSMVKNSNGTLSPQDPSVQAILAPFGTWGAQAFQQAMSGSGTSSTSSGSGTYNPATANTTAQTNNTNLATTQTASYNLDTALKQLDVITPTATNLLAQVATLNPTSSPIWNSQIATYVKSLGNTSAANQWQQVLTDIGKYQAQILSANNASSTPSAQTSQIASQDPSLLNLNQLSTYLGTLKTLGENQQSVLQTQINNLGGGSSAYTGTQQTPKTQLPTATPNTGVGSGVTSVPGMLAAGATQNVTTGLLGSVEKFIAPILAWFAAP